MEGLYKDLERRIIASPPGQCPVDLTASFLRLCHSQSCGKCVPCRVGLGQLQHIIDDIVDIDNETEMDKLKLLERTAEAISVSADCAIGTEAANMVLRGLKGYREDFESHILNLPVPTEYATRHSRFLAWRCVPQAWMYRAMWRFSEAKDIRMR